MSTDLRALALAALVLTGCSTAANTTDESAQTATPPHPATSTPAPCPTPPAMTLDTLSARSLVTTGDPLAVLSTLTRDDAHHRLARTLALTICSTKRGDDLKDAASRMALALRFSPRFKGVTALDVTVVGGERLHLSDVSKISGEATRDRRLWTSAH